MCIEWFGTLISFVISLRIYFQSLRICLFFFFPLAEWQLQRTQDYFQFFFSCCAFFHPNLLPLKALGNKSIAQPSSELCPSLSLHSVLHVSTAKWWGEICLGGYYNFFLSWFWIGKEVMAMLRLRAGDEKTNVRKSALQVQCFLHVFLFCVITQNEVKIIRQ